MSEFFEGFNSEEVENAQMPAGGNKPPKLPAGGYVLKILGAKTVPVSNGSTKIVFAFDIVEGEFKDYFKSYLDYDRGFRKDAKTRGVYDAFFPSKGNGSEEDMQKYNRSLGNLKAIATAINESNPTAKPIDITKRFSLDEFVGKYVGGVFGEKEWEWNGKSGMSVVCRWLVSAPKIRANDFTIPEPKYLDSGKSQSSGQSAPEFEDVISDGDVPF